MDNIISDNDCCNDNSWNTKPNPQPAGTRGLDKYNALHFINEWCYTCDYYGCTKFYLQ